MPRPILLPLLLLLFTQVAPASERVVHSDNGDEIPVAVFPADGGRLLIWLPSEFGSSPRRTALAERLAERGIEVWAPDLHAAWFLPTGRYSLNDVDPAAVVAVLRDAVAATDKAVFLMAEGRSTALALAVARAWQHGDGPAGRLAGLLAFSPNLYRRTPQGGEDASYLAIAEASNLPIYLLQPEDSAGFWRVAEDVHALESGGSPVFVHRLVDVSDGFYARPEFTTAEGRLSERLPAILDHAMHQLTPYGGAPDAPALLHGDTQAPERPHGDTLLRPFPGMRAAPALRLSRMDGEVVDLADLRGRVVLVNFWATWCPPCVEEIPSLQRLYRRLGADGLEVLAVDVGESAATMREFLRDKPISFPVLMDTDGAALRRWGVYAFPTSLVLDREHHIRFAVFGAFDWNSDEVAEALRPLLSGQTRPPPDR